MSTRLAQSTPAHQQGFVLIEVLVSALVLVIASAGVFALLQTTVRSQAEERHASEAYSLAQEDQARLSTMRVEELWKLNESRTIALNQTQFTVHSIGTAINDVTSTPSCGEGTYKVDYVQTTSIVTWPGMASSEKAKIVSKIAPSKGSINPANGTLAVSVTNQLQAPMPGVTLYAGGGAINGSTDATGCAIFPDLTAGNYSLTVSGEAAGLVNKMGQSFEVKTVSVVGGDTRRQAFEFDRPGKIPVRFKYRVGSGEEFKEPATADSVVAYNSGLTAARVFGTAGGTRGATVEATPLFPFSSAYTLYAGSCASNNPDPEGKGINAAAVANVVAPAGGDAPPVTLQLPALEMVVKIGGLPLPEATVTITDTACKEAKGNFVRRNYTTEKEGKPSASSTGEPEPGLPWGVYEVCASANISGTTRRKRERNVTVENLAKATTLSIELGSGNESGACP